MSRYFEKAMCRNHWDSNFCLCYRGYLKMSLNRNIRFHSERGYSAFVTSLPSNIILKLYFELVLMLKCRTIMVPLQIIYIAKQTFVFFGDYIENPLHTIGFEGEKKLTATCRESVEMKNPWITWTEFSIPVAHSWPYKTLLKIRRSVYYRRMNFLYY